MQKLTDDEMIDVSGGVSLDYYCHQATMIVRFNEVTDEQYLILQSYCLGNLYWYP